MRRVRPCLRPQGPRRPLLNEVCAAENLAEAWERVRAAHGAAGVDHVDIPTFEAHRSANLARLAHDLRAGTYQPSPALAFTIEKPDGGERHLGLLTVRDRVAQRAVYNVIAPLFERQFLDCSYAYRPGRNTAMAVAAVLAARRRGYVWAVDTDIADFFDALDHRVLLRRVGAVVQDMDILRLIRLWLEAGLLALPTRAPSAAPTARERGMGGRRRPRLSTTGNVAHGLAARGKASRRPRLTPPPRPHGAMQGAVLSPLLANAYLQPVDAALSRRYPRVVRYADDLLILCRTHDEAEEALRDLRVALAVVGLRLADEKTNIHHVDSPFLFLGYHVARGRATPPVARARVAPVTRVGMGMSGRRDARHRPAGVSAGGRRGDASRRPPRTGGSRGVRG